MAASFTSLLVSSPSSSSSSSRLTLFMRGFQSSKSAKRLFKSTQIRQFDELPRGRLRLRLPLPLPLSLPLHATFIHKNCKKKRVRRKQLTANNLICLLRKREKEQKKKNKKKHANKMKFFMVRCIYFIYRGEDIVTVCMFFKFPLLCNPPSLSLSICSSFVVVFALYTFWFLFVYFLHALLTEHPMPPLPRRCLLSFDSFKFPMLYPPLRTTPLAKALRYSSLIILMRLNASLSWNFIYLYLIFKQL